MHHVLIIVSNKTFNHTSYFHNFHNLELPILSLDEMGKECLLFQNLDALLILKQE